MQEVFEIKMIGSDPEFLIVKKSDKTAVSSIGLIEGEKKRPQDVGNGYAVLKDNVLVEGNIPPAASREEFISNMKTLKNTIKSMLNDDLTLACEDSASYSDKDLANPEANVFGCASYENAWSSEGDIRAEKITSNVRTVGTHVHISYEPTGKYRRRLLDALITKAFDICVTFPARLVHNDEFRSKHYGALGSFRTQPYGGVECRSLGGHWSKDKYLGWIYDNTMIALKLVQNEENIEKLFEIELSDLENNTEKVYNSLNLNLNSLKPE